MTFDEILSQVLELLQREGRVSYRALKRRFGLDDDYLEDLKDELIKAKQLARDEEGAVLVWTGDVSVASSQFSVASSSPPPTPQTADAGLRTPNFNPPDARLRTPNSELIAAERRQLTVMFCDLVGSTPLAELLDPEELRTVMQAYQQTCVAVITRFDGYVAKYLGDGLLVYFGYPLAHEDDAARAVRAGLGIIEAMQDLPLPHLQLPSPLQVRVGIHTGLVVAGEMGSGEYREERAIVGETPNIAARVQEKATPNTAIISAATSRLVQGFFACHDLGPQRLKGLSTPLSLYRVGVRDRRGLFEFEMTAVRRLIEADLIAPFNLSREAARLMIENREGRIVNITSIAGPIAGAGDAAYIATKGGLEALTRALAAELGQFGITVNGVAPGFFATETNANLVADKKIAAWLKKRTSLGRWGDPKEIAGTVVFFASPAASYITGQVLAVDGGYLAHF